MGVNDSTIGRLIDRMERNNLIERVKNDSDRRVYLLRLTKTGKRLFDKTLLLRDEFNKELIKGISDEDMNTFQRVLQTMVNNVSKENG